MHLLAARQHRFPANAYIGYLKKAFPAASSTKSEYSQQASGNNAGGCAAGLSHQRVVKKTFFFFSGPFIGLLFA
jgi:hypothetical protein